MEEKPISPQLRQFLANHIKSVEQLEILCLLGEEPSRSWSVAETYRCILSTEKSVQEGLQHFVAHNLFASEPEGRFRFAPKASDLNAAARDLIKTYRERRVAIIEMIYRNPTESARHFADAFRLRKEP